MIRYRYHFASCKMTLTTSSFWGGFQFLWRIYPTYRRSRLMGLYFLFFFSICMLHGLDLRYTPYKTYLWTCAGYIDEAPLQLHAFVSPEGEERFGGHESCHARGKTCLNHKLKTFIPGLGHQRSFESQRPVFSGNFPFEEKPSCKAWLWYKLILFYYGHS